MHRSRDRIWRPWPETTRPVRAKRPDSTRAHRAHGYPRVQAESGAATQRCRGDIRPVHRYRTSRPCSASCNHATCPCSRPDQETPGQERSSRHFATRAPSSTSHLDRYSGPTRLLIDRTGLPGRKNALVDLDGALDDLAPAIGVLDPGRALPALFIVRTRKLELH